MNVRYARAEVDDLFGRAKVGDGHASSIARDAPGLLHGLRPTRNEPARADRARPGGGAARLRLGVGRGGMGHGLRHRPLVARRDDGADQARQRDHADPRPHAVEHGDDRRDARSPLRRPLPARARHVGTAGRRGLARPAVGQAAREDARVRRDRPRSASTRSPRAPRDALRHPGLERDGARQAAQADGPPAARRHPDLPRRHGSEGRRAGVRDRRRLASDLLVAGEGARLRSAT